jgi:ferredoxin-NADP reductase
MATWHVGTLLKKEMVAANVMSLTFSLADWVIHKPGQHYDIRLTAPDGYQAERSYSAASTPEDIGVVEYGVQLLENGEVSPYLFQLKEGSQVEMRGPIGGHFVWDTSMPGPLILIGGGSGMVPLMAMLRHHMNHLQKDSGREIIFLVSARSLDLVLYKEELKKIEEKDPNVKVVITLTDTPPADWTGYKRRVDKDILVEVLGKIKDNMPMTYICGPTPFVEAVANHMIGLEFTAHSIKTERFGG